MRPMLSLSLPLSLSYALSLSPSLPVCVCVCVWGGGGLSVFPSVRLNIHLSVFSCMFLTPAFDPCYHLACDTMDNVNIPEFELLSRATAYVLEVHLSLTLTYVQLSVFTPTLALTLI